MKNKNTKFYLALLFTALYNFFFWKENLGLNALIFSALLLCTLLALNPGSRKYTHVKWVVTSTLLTAFMVVWHNSLAAKIAHVVALFVSVGLIYQPTLKTIYMAATSNIAAFIHIPETLKQIWQGMENNHAQVKRVYMRLQVTLVPVVVLCVFYFIYRSANPVFMELSDSFWAQTYTWFGFLFEDISLQRFVFVFFAFVLMIAAFYNPQEQKLVEWEMRQKDKLSRSRKRSLLETVSPKMLSLKQEYYAAVLLISATNVLLLVVNIIDINWIWFGFNYKDVQSLSQFVHEGTYMLILSILLSMVILLYYFRGNLNFYGQNRWLKFSAYCWIIQNGILLISVGIRNYHYIHQFGLAYKRIGVILFLALTLIGLYTFFIKIYDKRSATYLYKYNTWAVFALLVINSFMNWDVYIARYNISRTGPIDTTFLLSLSDKTLPILDQHRHIFSTLRGDTQNNRRAQSLSESDRLNLRIKEFTHTWKQRSWLSWNRAEYKAYKSLARQWNKTEAHSSLNENHTQSLSHSITQ
jgi:hypothetical protein